MANTWNQSGTTWGQNTYGTQTEVVITLTGVSSTSSVGSTTITADINTGWGQDGFGVENWGESGLTVILNGVQSTASVGTTLEVFNVQGWGRQRWGEASYGTDVTNTLVSLTGLQAQTELGTFDNAGT